MFANSTSKNATPVEERSCNNCAKACVVGKTYSGENLFNCIPQKGI